MIPKFRGKSTADENNDEWVYGNLVFDGKRAIIVNGIDEATDEYIAFKNFCTVDIDTVGQSTGSFDKNGQEIFEGDVVKCSGLLGIIKSFKAMWICSFVKYSNYQKVGFFAKEIEVVGNIYENWELVQEEKDRSCE